ncbi:DNA polymerase III subunit beta [Streptomyces cinereoruber]|uniref:DNA polymerase III subunit beta n=1 Tax=Streptomyces cinereoruber TaxID=67260 RepID=UPI003C2BAC75
MKLVIDHADLAAAVGYAARTLPSRPPDPVLAGLILDAGSEHLRVRAFDYEVSADTSVPATVTTPGRALVPGRLLADITAALRGNVHLALDGTRLSLRAGSARFSLPLLPLEEYPTLPEPGKVTGTLSAPAFAEAVAQVVCAVSREEALPVLTGVSLRHDHEAGTLTLSATDRYRYAVHTVPWKDAALPDTGAVIPDRAFRSVVKAVAGDATVDLVLPDGGGLFALRGEQHTTTIRALDGELPKYASLFPTEFAHTATVEIAVLKAAVQRVALVSPKKDGPIRLTFAGDGTLVLESGSGDVAQALDAVDTALNGAELSIAFNPSFLLDGLSALTAESVTFGFTSPTKPAVLRGHGSDDHALRYFLMPIRQTD